MVGRNGASRLGAKRDGPANDRAMKAREKTMCMHCIELMQTTNEIFAEMRENPETEAFFSSEAEDGGWLALEPKVSNEVLSTFERVLQAVKRWALNKGDEQAFAKGPTNEGPIPIPGGVMLALIHEVQMSRAMLALGTEETFTL